MSNLTIEELKEWIYENEKVQFVLEQIGCHHIKYHKDKEYWSACNFDGDNTGAINIKNNRHLYCKNHTRNIGDETEWSDLLTLISFVRKCKIKETVKWLHNILGFKYTYSTPTKKTEAPPDPLHIFKKVKYKKDKVNVLDLDILSEDTMFDYVPYIHIDWYKNEGIMPWTVDKFGLGYSYKRKRNVIPLRYWATGDLLGFNMRTTIENYELFDIPKYFITPNYPKQSNIYGLWENYDSIIKTGYVVVYEAEKSTLKRHSRGDPTGVAISGHSISDEQVRILIGLSVPIIIALDKDVSLNEIRYMCEKFYKIRSVYYIYDKYDLLAKKDSPADASNKVFDYLMKYKVKYDDKEHREYLKSQKGG